MNKCSYFKSSCIYFYYLLILSYFASKERILLASNIYFIYLIPYFIVFRRFEWLFFSFICQDSPCKLFDSCSKLHKFPIKQRPFTLDRTMLVKSSRSIMPAHFFAGNCKKEFKKSIFHTSIVILMRIRYSIHQLTSLVFSKIQWHFIFCPDIKDIETSLVVFYFRFKSRKVLSWNSQVFKHLQKGFVIVQRILNVYFLPLC